MKLNRYGGLSFEEFDRCLRECQSLWSANDEIAKILTAHANKYGEHAEFYVPMQSNSVISLLRIILRDCEDWISYWCCELNFGEYDGDDVTDLDGTPIPLHTTRQLWDFLVGNVVSADND